MRISFTKDIRELDLDECSMLAEIEQLLGRHSSLSHPERAKKRQAHVLRRMLIEGYIVEGSFTLTEQSLKHTADEIRKSNYSAHVQSFRV